MYHSNPLRVLLPFALLLILLPSALPLSSAAANISITIYFGKPQSCAGFGICRIIIGRAQADTAPSENNTERARPRSGRASAAIRDNKLFINLEDRLPERASVMPVSENVTLDSATSKALGYKSVTVLRGEYGIDYSKNRFGSVAVSVEARN
jgi:hypothetical protein